MTLRLQGEKLAEIMAALQTLEADNVLSRRQRQDIWPKKLVRIAHATEHLDQPYVTVVRRLLEEADWALLGFRSALNRLRALAANLGEQLGLNDLRPDAAALFEDRADNPLDEEQLLKYRAHLALAAVSECFFWLHACWDRLGISLGVAAFRQRQTRRQGWKRAWSDVRDEFGDAEAVIHSEPWRLATLHNREGFERINTRRNGLTHRASLAGLQAAPDDPAEAALLARFLYDMDAWRSLDLRHLVEDLFELFDITKAARMNTPGLVRMLTASRAR